MIEFVKNVIKDNKEIKTYRLTNTNGMIVEIISYGARISDIIMPDINGNLVHLVTGFNDPFEYLKDTSFFGTAVGRVANRIGGSEFKIDGVTYKLHANENGNHLHGGFEGFDKKFFDCEIVVEKGVQKLKASYFSPDREENYPGNLKVTIKYSLSEDNALSIEYSAISDKNTHCNLTNHSYFNLSGNFKTDILNHELWLNSSRITEIDEKLIPTGKVFDVSGTSLDFCKPKKIGADINDENELLKIAGGYDFNYIINDNNAAIAKVYCKDSGIFMEVYTDMPCVQLYTGNFIKDMKGRFNFYKQCAFCLETQKYPNACNIDSFPSTILKKDEEYYSKTVYKFGTKK